RAPAALSAFPTRRSSDLGIGHATGGGTGTVDRLGAGGILGPEHHGHHRPSGWARATTCISASSFDRASVWSPSRPFCPCTPTPRSEEHTSELQSRFDLVCRLLLEKKNNKDN